MSSRYSNPAMPRWWLRICAAVHHWLLPSLKSYPYFGVTFITALVAAFTQ